MRPYARPSHLRHRRAFTLLELIVVLVVLGLLAAIAIPTYNAVVDKSEEVTAEASVNAALRNAVAIAELEGNETPTIDDVIAAFEETPYEAAGVPGETAAAAGDWKVCVYGAGCSGDGVAVHFYGDPTNDRIGIIAETDPRVLGNISGTTVTTWASADGTIIDAVTGPVDDNEGGGGDGGDGDGDGPAVLDENDPTYIAIDTAASGEEFTMLQAATTTATVDVTISGGLALIVVAPLVDGNYNIGSPAGCDTATRTVISGSGFPVNCPGDPGYQPEVAGSPIGLACSGTCRFQISSPEPVGVAAFRIPNEFGGADYTAASVAALIE